jgi:DNA polymerase (family 10)
MAARDNSNRKIADVLEHVADLLEDEGENPFRVRGYRKAADTVRHARCSAATLYDRNGLSELERWPGVGQKLARSIQEIVETGHLRLADRLEAEADHEKLLGRVPGVGAKLAHRLHAELHIDSLEELEAAAHDGRLAVLPGIGDKRLTGIRDALAGMLSRSARRKARRRQRGDGQPEPHNEQASGTSRPDVVTLLDVDEEYRCKADGGKLKRISPRRFNPDHEAWLPILHTKRGAWSFTALYSNTARAHERGMTHDWVVLYFKRGGSEDQSTVVTATRGALRGRRVVRGRESECRAHYGADSG